MLSAGAHGAHPDVLLAACFIWAIVLDQRKRPVLTGLVLVIAVLVKIYAVLPLLVFAYVLLRRRDYRPLGLIALGAIAMAAAGYAPYWEGWSTLRGTFDTGLLSSSGVAGAVQGWLEIPLAWILPGDAAGIASLVIRVVGLVALVLTMVSLARNERTLREPWWAATVLLTVFILVTPWFLPWYVVGLIALSAPLADRTLATPLLVFSSTCMMTVPGLAGLSRTLVRYGPPLLVWQRLRRRREHDDLKGDA